MLVSLNSQLRLFSLGNPPGSTSFPVRCPGNSIKLLLETTLALTSSISCLSGGVVLYLLTFNFLQTVVLYILLIYFFSFFKFASGKRANSISVTTTPWSEAEISLFLFIADSIPLYSCTTVYLYMYWRSRLFPVWGNYKQSFYKHLCMIFLWEQEFSIRLNKYQEVVLLGHLVRVFYHFIRNVRLFLRAAAPFTSPTEIYEGSGWSTFLPALGIVSCLIISLFLIILSAWIVASHCGFN